MTFKELLNNYFASAVMQNGIYVLDDEKYMQEIVKLCNKHWEAKSFLFLGGEALSIKIYDTWLCVDRVLKLARPDMPQVMQKRFIRSARVLARLKSEFFPAILYLSLNPFYLLLDWSPGVTLREWRESELYNPDIAIELFRQLLQAVKLLHDNNIVHRDIRPDNIIVYRNTIRLIDFGLAKRDKDKKLTTTETLGNRYYSPPEQLTEAYKDVGFTADIYSLGQTFYFLITRQELEPGDYDPIVLVQFGLGNNAVDFYANAIQIEPKDRFQNATEMLERYTTIFPVINTTSYTQTIYDIAESLFILLGGDLFLTEIFTSHFMPQGQILRLLRVAASRRAKKLLSS